MTTHELTALSYLKSAPYQQLQKEVSTLNVMELEQLIGYINSLQGEVVSKRTARKLTKLVDYCYDEQYELIWGGYDRIN